MKRDVVGILTEESKSAFDISYREAISSLLYFAICTRKDIASSVGTLAKFFEASKQLHWSMVKRVLRYLKVTVQSGIFYQKSKGKRTLGTFIGYSDSDWAGFPCRKSTSGSALYFNDCLISWKCEKQGLVAF